MLNDEDVKNLNKLLHLMKHNKTDRVLQIEYHSKYGWYVSVWDPEGWSEFSMFKKRRLGTLCIDKIVDLVQERLNGDA